MAPMALIIRRFSKAAVSRSSLVVFAMLRASQFPIKRGFPMAARDPEQPLTPGEKKLKKADPQRPVPSFPFSADMI